MKQALHTLITSIFKGARDKFSGSNGLPLGSYFVICSTNLALPMTNWWRVMTNQFDAAGNFSFTSPLDFNLPGIFYLLQVP